MTTMNISLPDEMKAFIEAEGGGRGFRLGERVSAYPHPRCPETAGQAGTGREVPRSAGKRPRHTHDERRLGGLAA